MAEYIPMVEYRKRRPRRNRIFGPFFKILSKFNRDWVFGWKLRNSLYRLMGVQIAKINPPSIGRETWIDDNFPELIRIDEGVGISWRCVIMVHNTAMPVPSVAPVHICRKVHIGQGVTIMPGVTIGEYAQVGTGAVVTKDVEPYTLVVGVPAKPVRKLTQEEIERCDIEDVYWH